MRKALSATGALVLLILFAVFACDSYGAHPEKFTDKITLAASSGIYALNSP
jgi:hypothetical protein